MSGDDIKPDDQVARCVVFDKAYLEYKLVALRLLPFEGKQSEISGVWRARAPNANDVHERGCKLAAKQNERVAEREGKETTPGVDRLYYGGFVEARRREIETENERFKLVVFQRTEEHDDAHAAIQFVVVQSNASKHEINVWKTEASRRLGKVFKDAREFVCAVDKGDNYHPKILVGPGYLTVRD